MCSTFLFIFSRKICKNLKTKQTGSTDRTADLLYMVVSLLLWMKQIKFFKYFVVLDHVFNHIDNLANIEFSQKLKIEKLFYRQNFSTKTTWTLQFALVLFVHKIFLPLKIIKKDMILSRVFQIISFPSLFVIWVRVNCKNRKLTVYRKYYFFIL